MAIARSTPMPSTMPRPVRKVAVATSPSSKRGQDDVVDHPADREARRHGEQGEHRGAADGDAEQLRLHRDHRPDESAIAASAFDRTDLLVEHPVEFRLESPVARRSVTGRFYQRVPAISSRVVNTDSSTRSPRDVEPAPSAYVVDDTHGPWRRSKARKALLVVGVVGFVAFWMWALFFASKEAVNRIDDRAWAERAEAICADYDVRIRALEARGLG